jgi:hypothetical protein
VPCDGEFRAGWFVWALRDATAAAGHYTRVAAAQEYYGRLAKELDAACANGELHCQPKTGTLAPRFRTAYLRSSLNAAVRLFGVAAADVRVPQPWALRSVFFTPSYDNLWSSVFLESVSAALYIHYLSYFGPDHTAADYQNSSISIKRASVFLAVIDVVSRVWGNFAWIIHLAGIFALTALPLLWRAYPNRACWPLYLVSVGAQLIFLSRVLLLAYVDAVAIPSINLLYLSPVMPLLILADAMLLIQLGRTLWPQPAKPPGEGNANSRNASAAAAVVSLFRTVRSRQLHTKRTSPGSAA